VTESVCALVGRARVIEDVRAFLDAGRSVLLVGPHGSGTTAIINVVRREEMLVVDPFAAITTPRASALRRALDRGVRVLGAACSLDRADMGHVGRVAWRFERVYVRPLAPRAIGRIVRRQMDAQAAAGLTLDPQWMSEAVEASAGLPGRAVALASVAAARWREREMILPPRLALLMAWQDGLAGTAGYLYTTGRRPGESSS
jgi:hypothetical protein